MTINTLKRAMSCMSDDELPIAYQYTGVFNDGETLWAFFTHPEYDDIHSSPFVCNPIPLKVDNKLTDYGVQFMAGNLNL